MKTLKTIISDIAAIISITMFLSMLGTVEVQSYVGLLIWVIVASLFGIISYLVSNTDEVVSRMVAVVCVLKAFKASHSRKLNKSDLLILRRKNQVGSYHKLYLDCMERYYA